VREISRLLDDGRHKRVLEIGGGNSTFFFSERVAFLMTIEEDAKWAAHIQQKISKKVNDFQLVNIKLDDWLNSRTKENMDFDIVLIDGGSDSARKKALEILPSLNPNAVYILDNSDREIFYQLKFLSHPKNVIRHSGLIRHPFQATETTFYFF
jgi:predicted O-methyltransferase YrrM